MAIKLKGLSKLKKAIENLVAISEETRENLEIKRSENEEKSDRWQESETGEEWAYYLDTLEALLDDIENLDTEILEEV